ncbi:murein biosynthesis integral membrane protein MurJ [Faecalitalea cylindroides]|uniref:murein biosynthesis integral membrane protein MurJ n=1 Tax=Faecalitalea cylindroides TaxID=39483 RepID=UPI003AB6B312
MKISRGKTISVVMIITLVSKCLGFLRDMVLAYCYGANTITDAYYVAQTIPEFLFSLVVQAIAIGFIPIYMDILNDNGEREAFSFTKKIHYLGWIFVCVLIAVVYLFSEPLVKLFASGFDPSTAKLAEVFIKISVWGMFFRISAAVDSAFLNANNNFTIPSLTGVPLDIITIISIFVSYYLKIPEILAVGIVVSSLSQMILQKPSVKKVFNGFKNKDFKLFDVHVKKMIALFLPVAIGVGASQINLLVDRTLASTIEGGISALNYANKVNNILENIMILSLATVMFPTFSKHAAKNDIQSLSNDISHTLLITIVIMLPCSFFSFIYAVDAIQILFGRGAFDATAVNLTVQAMQFYSIGLIFISCNAILVRAMYSLKKVKTVSLCSWISVFVNVLLNLFLMRYMQIRGLALATSIANMCTTILLLYNLKKQIGSSFIKNIKNEVLKIIGISFVVCIVAFLLDYALNLFINELVACCISASISILLYLFLTIIFKVSIITDTVKKIMIRFA